MPQLNKNQFRTYLLIYAAHVDYEFTQDEREFLELNCEPETLKEMLELFNNQSDYSSLEMILSHKEHYLKTKQEREQLYSEVIKLFNSDGDYSRPEKTFLAFLDKMIEMNPS